MFQSVINDILNLIGCSELSTINLLGFSFSLVEFLTFIAFILLTYLLVKSLLFIYRRFN